MKRVKMRVIGAPYRGMPVGYEFGASEADASRLLANRRAEAVEVRVTGKAVRPKPAEAETPQP